MSRALQRCAMILLCSAVAACATDEPAGGPGGGPGGRGGPPRRLPNVFISPAGEPFRASPGAPYPVVDWFTRSDADHDGKLTRAEFKADALSFFDRLDANHDGVIDSVELGQYEQVVAPEILPQIEGLHAEEGFDPDLTFGDPNNTDNRPQEGRSRRKAADRPQAPPRGIGVQGAAVYSLINSPEPIAAADSAFDGRISRAEFATATDRRFDTLDKGGLGYLALATLPKTPLQVELLKRKKQEDRRRSRRPPQEP